LTTAVLAIAATIALAADPAHATGDVPKGPQKGPEGSEPVRVPLPAHAHRSPELAAGLTVAAPVGLLLIASQAPSPVVVLSLPLVGLAAGHVYAGDPLRGALAATGGGLMGMGVFSLLSPRTLGAGNETPLIAVVSAAVAIGVAATDAYLTAQEWNHRAVFEDAPQASLFRLSRETTP
jgi:hypothetical protein